MISPYAYAGLTTTIGAKKRSPDFWIKLAGTVVSEYYDLPIEAIRGKRRDAYIVRARRHMCYLLRKKSVTSVKIGEYFSCDHTDILYHADKVESALSSDKNLLAEIMTLTEQITNRLS